MHVSSSRFRRVKLCGVLRWQVRQTLIGVTHVQETCTRNFYQKLSSICISTIVRFDKSAMFESFWHKKNLHARNRATFYSVQVSGTSFLYKFLERVSPPLDKQTDGETNRIFLRVATFFRRGRTGIRDRREFTTARTYRNGKLALHSRTERCTSVFIGWSAIRGDQRGLKLA